MGEEICHPSVTKEVKEMMKQLVKEMTKTRMVMMTMTLMTTVHDEIVRTQWKEY